MNPSVTFLYVDIQPPEKELQKIVGKQPYSTIIYRRQNLKNRTIECLDKISYFSESAFFFVDEDSSILQISEKIQDDSLVFCLFSYSLISYEKNFLTFVEKLRYTKENICICDEETPLFLCFKDKTSFKKYFLSLDKQTFHEMKNSLDFKEKSNTFFCDISNYRQFISFLSGGFDARFFNSLSGTEYTVTKSSTDKIKMKKEYTYYHLLPDEMKIWCILPYNFQEFEDHASYTMERLGITDMAIRWVHHAISPREFERFLNKIFFYFTHRTKKEICQEVYKTNQNKLFIVKVEERIEQLKNVEGYKEIAHYISSGTRFSDIDEIFSWYKSLYQTIVNNISLPSIAVIGHGDPCFSNILYDMDTETLKLIDPKGALTEEELWVDPFYDIAKLSHSICGLYDFFNNGLYSISLDENMNFSLVIDQEDKEQQIYQELFQKKLEENNISYLLVRIYESSLFLSMLPLHMDNPKKVFAFILNAIRILDELDSPK